MVYFKIELASNIKWNVRPHLALIHIKCGNIQFSAYWMSKENVFISIVIKRLSLSCAPLRQKQEKNNAFSCISKWAIDKHTRRNMTEIKHLPAALHSAWWINLSALVKLIWNSSPDSFFWNICQQLNIDTGIPFQQRQQQKPQKFKKKKNMQEYAYVHVDSLEQNRMNKTFGKPNGEHLAFLP